jgi:anti-sigma factor (TIGR02949 family)
MECSEASKYLQVYLDGEFDEAERRDMEAHLAACPTCQKQAELERRFRESVRSRLAAPVAPEGLRERVRAGMAAEPEARRIPRSLLWGSLPAAAALLLVLSFTWTVTSGFSPLLREAVERHTSEPPVEVKSSDADEVESWFQRKVDFRVALPRFVRTDLDLVGARLSHLAARQAALVRYQHGRQSFSLFVLADPGPGEDIGSKRCQRLHKREVCLSELQGYTVVAWRTHGLLYSLVGDAPPAHMLQVLTGAGDE